MQHEWKVKILLLGKKNSGKEDFCSRFTIGFSHQFEKDMGVDIFIKDLDINQEELISLAFWNLTKSKYLDFLLPNFIRGSDAALIWFNLVKKDSFEEAIFWTKLLRKEFSQLPVLLIGNIRSLEKEREIASKEIKNLIETYNIPIYIETSVQNTFTIQNILKLLGEILIDAKKLKKQKIDFRELNPNLRQKIDELATLKQYSLN
jgi:Ras-related protein Rab-6A